jgi:hypothetical protein
MALDLHRPAEPVPYGDAVLGQLGLARTKREHCSRLAHHERAPRILTSAPWLRTPIF